MWIIKNACGKEFQDEIKDFAENNSVDEEIAEFRRPLE